MSKLFFSLALITLSFLSGNSQKYKVVTCGFYNLENLFDTENDTSINDEEFLSEGTRKWTPDKYREKLMNMAEVISKIGLEESGAGLSILGVCEIENKKVLKDLVKEPSISKRRYQVIHYDSPDQRGVDVGFLYNPAHFEPLDHKPIPLITLNENGSRRYTRDILYIKGILDAQDTIHILVNHWPSRSGGEKISAPARNMAAKICRSVYDSLLMIETNPKLMIMGDLNDDPVSESIVSFLRAKANEDELTTNDLFNPFHNQFKKGLGSNAYRDTWSLFDQIIISHGLASPKSNGYHFLKSRIFNEEFLRNASGQYKGYPFRTFNFDEYQSGYSDHFPTYITLVKLQTD